ncbi:MAG: transcription antitermination factor NusB, partial [Phormidesmis sp.]
MEQASHLRGQNPALKDAKTARQIAFETLRSVERGAFADVVLDRKLTQSQLSLQDKGFVTELVYGTVRRRRTLDALITQFGKRVASRQQADLLQILRLGFYQLRYLTHVPDHAVVDTTVQLAKAQRLGKLSGVVNGMLRQYIRQSKQSDQSLGKLPAVENAAETDDRIAQIAPADPLLLPVEPTTRLGVLHSYPDWIIQVWQSMLPDEEVSALCEWFNQPPALDLRINLRRHSLAEAAAIFGAVGIEVEG